MILSEALQQAGSSSTFTPEVARLMKNRITPESNVPPMRFLFKLFGVECFPRGEVVAVAGKAKSGKTLFLSLLMTAALRGEVLDLKRQDEEPLRVMWYDTEQSRQSTHDILVNRIKGTRDLWAFNVRTYRWTERLGMFCGAIPYLKPDLVILDGVRDLIADINDGAEAQAVTEMLMTLAQQYECCIVCVLHKNKSDSDNNMRGWIGTELTNKVFEVYSCEKLADSTFKVSQIKTRKWEIGRALYFQLDKASGLPVSAQSAAPEQPRNAQQRTMLGKSADELKTLFATAMENRQQRPYIELMGVAMRKGLVSDAKAYYACFGEAERLGVVRRLVHPTTGVEWVELTSNGLPFEG